MRSPVVLNTLLAAALAAVLLHAVEATAAEAVPGRPRVEEVIVVFKTHFDIGYTALAREVVDRYRTSMIDQALDVCDRSAALPNEKQFVWTVPGWPMTQILWPGQTAQRRERLEAAVRSGRLVWHALPGSLHTESLDLEDLVRGLGFSSQLSRQFGQPLALDAKMTDVPSHSWIMPTLLAHAGVRFLHIGCNSASGSPDVPRLFWWEGPDGSRLLTIYEASGYGSGLQPPAGWPHRTWLAMIHTGDNHGPPRPEEVDKLLENAARDLPGVTVRLGRLSDFAAAILAENPDLPVVRADMPDTWIHGIMSMPEETKLARCTRPRIAGLESLDTLLRLWGVESPPAAAQIAAAYEGSLMYGEHTWGYSIPLDRRPYGSAWREELRAGKYDRFEESWQEHGANIRRAAAIVEPAFSARMTALAEAVEVRGPRVVVFNPLPWRRDSLVSFDLPAGVKIEGLQDTAGGEITTAESTERGCRFLARDLPPLGYKTFVPTAPSRGRKSESPPDSSVATLENEFFALTLDPARGVIASLVDKRTGRELVASRGRWGFGQYLYERFDEDMNQAYLKAYLKEVPSWVGHFTRFDMPPASEAPYSATSPRDFRCEVRRTPCGTTALMTAAPGESQAEQVALEVTLPTGLPYLDVAWSIRGKQPDTWPEAGWLCLPLAIEEPRFRLGRLGAVIDPANDVCRGANHEVFCLNSGLTVTGADGDGVAVCPLDSPLVSLGRPGVMRHTVDFEPRESVVLVNLFNNAWGTNFRQWISGSWSSRVRLWTIEGDSIENDLVVPSWEARVPAEAVYCSAPAGRLPASQAGLELSPRGVLLTAFGANPDGDGLVLRLWEQAGRNTDCRIRLPSGLRSESARRCNLRGEFTGDALTIKDGQLECVLGRYQPESLILD